MLCKLANSAAKSEAHWPAASRGASFFKTDVFERQSGNEREREGESDLSFTDSLPKGAQPPGLDQLQEGPRTPSGSPCG